jgi:enamine deaminase RidA (YjgF/YER057c/UK114 family)
VSVYKRLDALNIALLKLTPPVAAFLPFLRNGNLLFLAGHIAKVDGAPWAGKLGANLTTEQGKNAARAVAIDLIGTLQAAVQDLNHIQRIIKLMVLVNSTPEFTEQHLVANGASELFAQVFGDSGMHVRSAFGVSQIPFGACVEIDLIAEVNES